MATKLTAADLRVGNLVLCDGKICKVVLLEEDGIGVRWQTMRAYTHKYASVEPIPLTEKLLDKTQFKGRKYFKWNGVLGIQIKEGNFYLSIKDKS